MTEDAAPGFSAAIGVDGCLKRAFERMRRVGAGVHGVTAGEGAGMLAR